MGFFGIGDFINYYTGWNLPTPVADAAEHLVENNPFENEFGGLDRFGGAGNPELREKMIASSEDVMDKYREEQATTIGGPYGMFGEEEFEYGFDPTDVTSIAEALARKEFGAEVDKEISDINVHQAEGSMISPGWKHAWEENVDEGGIWSYGDTVGSGGGSGGGWTELDAADVEEYWDDWLAAQKASGDFDIFLSQAKGAGITQGEINVLAPGASLWRNMARPMQQEAGDVYRDKMSSILAKTGGLRTGSAAQRRRELRQDYSGAMADIKGQVSGERKKRSDLLANRIRKLVQSS
tara:strand:- start:2014 stop:2898 length:885 start_codon:yes stop_codon:yes gene_type:complete